MLAVAELSLTRWPVCTIGWMNRQVPYTRLPTRRAAMRPVKQTGHQGGGADRMGQAGRRMV